MVQSRPWPPELEPVAVHPVPSGIHGEQSLTRLIHEFNLLVRSFNSFLKSHQNVQDQVQTIDTSLQGTDNTAGLITQMTDVLKALAGQNNNPNDWFNGQLYATQDWVTAWPYTNSTLGTNGALGVASLSASGAISAGGAVSGASLYAAGAATAGSVITPLIKSTSSLTIADAENTPKVVVTHGQNSSVVFTAAAGPVVLGDDLIFADGNTSASVAFVNGDIRIDPLGDLLVDGNISCRGYIVDDGQSELTGITSETGGLTIVGGIIVDGEITTAMPEISDQSQPSPVYGRKRDAQGNVDWVAMDAGFDEPTTADIPFSREVTGDPATGHWVEAIRDLDYFLEGPDDKTYARKWTTGQTAAAWVEIEMTEPTGSDPEWSPSGQGNVPMFARTPPAQNETVGHWTEFFPIEDVTVSGNYVRTSNGWSELDSDMIASIGDYVTESLLFDWNGSHNEAGESNITKLGTITSGEWSSQGVHIYKYNGSQPTVVIGGVNGSTNNGQLISLYNKARYYYAHPTSEWIDITNGTFSTMSFDTSQGKVYMGHSGALFNMSGEGATFSMTGAGSHFYVNGTFAVNSMAASTIYSVAGNDWVSIGRNGAGYQSLYIDTANNAVSTGTGGSLKVSGAGSSFTAEGTSHLSGYATFIGGASLSGPITITSYSHLIFQPPGDDGYNVTGSIFTSGNINATSANSYVSTNAIKLSDGTGQSTLTMSDGALRINGTAVSGLPTGVYFGTDKSLHLPDGAKIYIGNKAVVGGDATTKFTVPVTFVTSNDTVVFRVDTNGVAANRFSLGTL